MSNRPNILLIMCDQLNPATLSCYGGPVPTRNIDRLAAEGVRFTDAICPCPMCSPSRASLITGLYPHAHGITCNTHRRDYPAIPAPKTEEAIKADEPTTERILNAAGYDTHQYGKWHLRDDDLPYYPDMYGEHHEYADEMADTFARVRSGPRESYMEWYGWALPVRQSRALTEAVRALGGRWDHAEYFDFVAKMGRLELPVEKTFDARVADCAVQYLRDCARPPFMLTCSFNWPHDPNVVPSPYYEMFDPDAIELPANFNAREARYENQWSRRIVADLGEVGARELMRVYYACVKLIDDQVGRVLGALEASGQANDTIVVFTADHSDMCGGHGMVWKSTDAFYEEVVGVPFILRYPPQVRPGVTGLPLDLTDVMPTLLDLCGLAAPAHVQGHSLVPFVSGTRSLEEAPRFRFCERVAANPEHIRHVSEDVSGHFMVRGEGWKYVRHHEGEEQLFDLDNDPGETCNLAAEPQYENRKKQLRRRLETWLVETGLPRRWGDT